MFVQTTLHYAELLLDAALKAGTVKSDAKPVVFYHEAAPAAWSRGRCSRARRTRCPSCARESSSGGLPPPSTHGCWRAARRAALRPARSGPRSWISRFRAAFCKQGIVTAITPTVARYIRAYTAVRPFSNTPNFWAGWLSPRRTCEA